MNSRMDKYYKENTLEDTRTSRNKDIYNKISDADLESLSLTSNISILGDDTANLNIEKLKKLLDEKYAKPKADVTSYDVEEEEEAEEEDTKEYDLKKIIDEAHKNKDADYEKERFKKLRDTQFDILNSLNLDRESEPEIEESLTVEETNLMNLIKTVNENSLKREEILSDTTDADLLNDLKGDDGTEILEPVNLEEEDADEPDALAGKKPTILEELEKTKRLSKEEFLDKIEETKVEEEQTLEENDENVEEITIEEEEEEAPEENTFYTGKYKITDADLDDFKELEKEMKSGGVFIKILILLIVVILVVIGVYALNNYLNLGLF